MLATLTPALAAHVPGLLREARLALTGLEAEESPSPAHWARALAGTVPGLGEADRQALEAVLADRIADEFHALRAIA